MSAGRRFLRVLGGAVLAPLAPLVALGAIDIAMSGFEANSFILIFMIGAPFVYGAMLVFGVPAIAVARWLRWDGLWTYLIGGLVVGALIGGIFALTDPGLGGAKEAMIRGVSGLFPFVAGCGFLVSAAFWLIARPDRFGGRHEKSSIAPDSVPGLVSDPVPGGDDAPRQ